MEYFWVSSLNLSSQLVISVSNPNVSIITTNVSNIAVLLSHNVTCFAYFMTMSHGINKKAPTIVSHQPPPPAPPLYQVLIRFVCCFTRNILWTQFGSAKIIAKIMHFQSKTNFLIQLIAGQFWFCCFVYMFFLGRFFTALLSWNYESFIFACMHRFLFGLLSNMWHNKRISCHCQ